MKYLKTEYRLIGFEKSKRAGKKYDALLQHKKTGKIVRVPFGAVGYETYSDKTGLGLYNTHNDKVRLNAFRNRFRKLIKNKDYNRYYSPIWFSNQYLW
jgi:hypothetical protein